MFDNKNSPDLCDRLNGDRNLVINDNDDYFYGVSQFGADLEDAGVSLSPIQNITDLAKAWCRMKGIEFKSVHRQDLLYFYNAKVGAQYIWSGRGLKVKIVEVNRKQKFIQLRLIEPTDKLDPTWRLYEHHLPTPNNHHGEILYGDLRATD